MLVVLATGIETNNKRFWGLGIIGTPTAAIPLTNGVVFEVDVAGLLYGATYSNSVRTQQVALIRPTDGLIHRYCIYYKASKVFFEIDNIQVGSLSFPNPQISSLNCVIGSINNTTAPTVSATFNISVINVADTGKNSIKISDGLFPWRMQTVKAPSVTPVSTDLAGVVSLHPLGNGIRGAVLTSQTTNFAAAGVGNTTGLDISTAANVTFIVKNTVAATAFTGTPVIIFEQSDDNVSWAGLSVVRSDSGLSASTHTLPANTANTSIMFDCAAEGNSFVRARVTTGTATGGMTIVVQPGSLPFSPTVTAILNPETTKVIGSVSLATPSPTYSVVVSNVPPAALATDILTIYGSATKTISIINVIISGVQTTASQALFLLIKRSTANTGGTSTAPTKLAYDTNDTTATASVLLYSANPTTLGTILGNIRGDRVFLPGAATASDAQGIDWMFTGGKNAVLRGVAQGFAVNLAGVTITGGSINVTIEWTES